MKNFAFTLFSLSAVVVYTCTATPVLEQQYRIEAFQKDGDSETLVLRLKPVNIEELVTASARQSRQFGFQEVEEEAQQANQPHTPNPNHFIPAVIPALTQIFQGIITGNINQIVHGSSSFAPQNVSHHIDSVYNQVVGIAPPVSTPPTEAPQRLSQVVETTPVPVAATSPAPLASSESESATADSAPSTTKASNEDDEEETEGGLYDRLGYRRVLKRRENHKRIR